MATHNKSPSSQREWIEIRICSGSESWPRVSLFTEGVDWNTHALFLTPRDECLPLHRGSGLKCNGCRQGYNPALSPSSQREWIEICNRCNGSDRTVRLPLHRGSGLKSLYPVYRNGMDRSPSSQREWIEIAGYARSERGWKSPSSQREWIEISIVDGTASTDNVSLFTEGVDWNGYNVSTLKLPQVSLFTEGVDWNPLGNTIKEVNNVSLFTEGVDWNHEEYVKVDGFEGLPLHRGSGLKSDMYGYHPIETTSPSSQREWIEIIVIKATIKRITRLPLHRGSGLKCLC